MFFTTTTLLSTLALLTPLTSSAPTTRQSATSPPYITSRNFKLVANVTSGTLPINNFIVESYHIDATSAYAILSANTSTAEPRTFYVNGTATEYRFGETSTLTDSGSGNSSFPEFIQINPEDPIVSANNRSTVYIKVGAGQPYVGLTTAPDPIIQLHGYQGETFYACNETLPYGPAYQLFYRGYTQVTPEGCAEVALLPQCSEGSGAADAFANDISCYEDVAGIDWSLYEY